MSEASSRPALRGTILALVSAVAFGVTTPLVQRLGRDVGSFATAALLYAGAASVGLVSRSRSEAQPTRAHAPRLVVVAVFGAGLAPAALAWGLGHTSGTAASLMLNLEAVFTIVLARLLYGEHVGARVGTAATLLVAGGALLVAERASGGVGSGATSALGLAAIAGAALGWALDNAIAKPLSSLDPASVVAGKGTIGALLSTCAALALGERWPSLAAAAGLAVLGATGYGLSLRLYLRAQRALGAGRTASVFAAAPFVGAGLAWVIGEPAGIATALAGAIMIVGLALHVTEKHAHSHEHEPIEHEHAHRHDDGHHDDHTHPDGTTPEGEHTHLHRHARRRHDHPHVPDLHHAHDHDDHDHDHGPPTPPT